MAGKSKVKALLDKVLTDRPKPLSPRAGQRLDPKTKYGKGGKVCRKKAV